MCWIISLHFLAFKFMSWLPSILQRGPIVLGVWGDVFWLCVCFRITISLNIMDVFQSITVIILLMLKLSHLWPQKAFPSWFQSILDITPKVIDSFPALWFGKLFQAHCYTFPAPDLESVLYQGALVLFKEEQYWETTIWVLNLVNEHRGVHFYWAGRCF